MSWTESNSNGSCRRKLRYSLNTGDDGSGGDGYDISEKTLRHTIVDVHKLTVGGTSSSLPEMIRGLPWRILVMPRPGQENKKQYLGFFLQCNSESSLGVVDLVTENTKKQCINFEI